MFHLKYNNLGLNAKNLKRLGKAIKYSLIICRTKDYNMEHYFKIKCWKFEEGIK